MTSTRIFSPAVVFDKKFIYSECLNEKAVLSETSTFEEYPLIFRNKQIRNWRENFREESIFPMWIGCAIFLLGHYRLTSKNKYFFGITIKNFEADGGRPPIPNIFVSTSIKKIEFLNRLLKTMSKIDSKEMKITKLGFKKAGMLNAFKFYESRFFDESSKSEIVRIYCI